MTSSDDRQRPGPSPWTPGERIFLQGQASGDAVIYQAGRDQHLHYEDGVRGRQRSEPGVVVSDCPYPGLAAFGSEQARWFFGRDELIAAFIDDLNRRLSTGGMQIVVAPSGAGKSSLLRAGLLPKLRHAALPGSDQWPAVLFTPTAQPMRAFAEQVASLTGVHPGRIAHDLASDPDRCISVLHETFRRRAQPPSAEVRLVVVVDQFEELFALCTDDQQRQRFIELLAKIAAPRPGARSMALVVVGVRADFYAACVNYPLLRAALQDWPLVVGPMSETELREAILYPARDVGLEIEPGLVEMLLRDLGATTTDDGETTSYEADRLPLLAHALRASWQQRHGATLTVAGYQTTGGIQRAVAVTADRAYTSLDVHARQVAKALFLRLVKIGDNTEDTRRRLARAELVGTSADPQTASAVLDTFTRVRLLTQRQDTVEITHEALLCSWPLLRRWIGTDRANRLIHQDLEDAATAWNRTHDTAQLYRGSRLETARSLVTGLPDAYLSSIAHAFLAASTRLRRRGRRLRVGGIAGLAILAIAALIGALLAGINAGEANRQHAVALSRQLAAQSQAINVGSVTARRLAAAAWRSAPTAEAHDSMAILLDQQRYTLIGHTDSVLDVAFSPDGKLLASADDGGLVRLWDPASRRQVLTPLTGHSSSVFGVVFSPDGKILATASRDQTVRLWDPTTGRQIGAPFAGPTAMLRVAFSPNGRILATADDHGGVQLWDPATGKALYPPFTGGNTGTAFAFSPDGKILATANGHFVQLWDPATGRPLGRLGQEIQDQATRFTEVSALAFSPDGKILATGNTVSARRTSDPTISTTDTTVQLWNLVTKSPVGPSLTGYTNSSLTPAMRFSPDGKILAAAGSARMWDLTTGQPIGPLLDSTGEVTPEALAFSPDGRILATDSGSGDAVQLWDPATGHPFTRMLIGHTDGVDAVAYSPDGKILATASLDQTVRLWDAATGHQLAPPLTGSEFAFSPDGKTLATTRGRSVSLWDPATGKPRGPPLTGDSKGVAFSPDGKILAASNRETVQRWDLATGQSLNPPLTHTNQVLIVAFSPDGRVLATASDEEETVRLWEPTTGRLLSTLPTGFMYSGNSSLAFRPDGKVLATAGSDNGTVRLWDPTTGHMLGAPLAHADEIVGGVAFSPNGKVLATTSDTNVRLWDPATGQLLSTQSDGDPNGSVIAFSPDGKVLATANANGARLWDPTGGRPLSPPLTDHTDRVTAVTFSPDSKTMATASDDYTVRLWEPHLYLEPAAAICAQLGPLTEEEWTKYAPGEPLPASCL